MGNLLRCHGDTSDDSNEATRSGRRRRRRKECGADDPAKNNARSAAADPLIPPLKASEPPSEPSKPSAAESVKKTQLDANNLPDAVAYAEKARIDDEVLVVRFLHLMDPTVVGGLVGVGHRHGGEAGGSGEPPRRNRVSFRAESFDSQSSTTSERREFIIDLVDSLPETFVDDALPPASARGRLASWSSCSEVFVDCPETAAAAVVAPAKIALVA